MPKWWHWQTMQAEHTFCLTALTIKAAYVNKKGLMNGWYTGRYAFRYTGSLLLPIWSLQSTAHLKPFLWNFFVWGKRVSYTLGSSYLSFQDLVVDFACFPQIMSSKIERSLRFDWCFCFSVSSILFDWNLVRLGLLYYARRCILQLLPNCTQEC